MEEGEWKEGKLSWKSEEEEEEEKKKKGEDGEGAMALLVVFVSINCCGEVGDSAGRDG